MFMLFCQNYRLQAIQEFMTFPFYFLEKFAFAPACSLRRTSTSTCPFSAAAAAAADDINTN